jgi:hypothetical protein
MKNIKRANAFPGPGAGEGFRGQIIISDQSKNHFHL